MRRRRALTGWACANGALIAEDDCDGEFRYDVAALPALLGLDPRWSSTWEAPPRHSPALRVGWLAARPEPVTQFAQAADRLGGWATEPAQRAVHTRITTSDPERHLRA